VPENSSRLNGPTARMTPVPWALRIPLQGALPMPELDFMVTADYVRAESGVLHMIAAGFDTMIVPVVPTVRPVGIGLRLLLDVAEARQPHEIQLIYQDADGQRLTEISGTMGPIGEDQPLPPPGRPFGVPMAFNLMLPVPAHGDYSLELLVDGEPKKSITLTIADPHNLPGAPGHA
jgi:Family of unknown function (DUF6941)